MARAAKEQEKLEVDIHRLEKLTNGLRSQNTEVNCRLQ
jgi:hypothetical protein